MKRLLFPWLMLLASVLLVAALVAFANIDPAAAASGVLFANAGAGLELQQLQLLEKGLREYGVKMTDFIKSQTDNFTKVADSYKEIRARMLDVEQKLAKKGSGGGLGEGDPLAEMTELITKSEALAAFLKGNTNAVNITIPSRLFKTAIVNATGQNQPLVAADRRVGIVFAPQQRLTIRDLFTSVPTTSNAIEYCKEATYTNNAGPQYDGTSPSAGTEGAPKNESGMTFTLETSPVITLAHWIPASRQVLADAPALQQHLDNRLLYGLKLEEEEELLTGDNTSGKLNGMTNQAVAFTRGSTNLTALDAIALSFGQLIASNYMPSGVVLNASDWYSSKFLLAKDSDGNYILGNPTQMTTPQLWGIPVVPTNSMTSGQFLTLDAPRAGYIADREDATVRISESHSDFFVRNMVAILCEERLAFVCTQAGAMVYGSLDHAG